MDASDVRRFRSDVEATTPDTATLANGARTAGTVLAGVVFAVIASFFFLRDGRKMVDSEVALLPVGWHEDAWSIAHSIVSSLAYYACGAAALGAFVGAIIAGLVAVGATLVSAGTTPAIIVAVVALVVQQLDNDFLAPSSTAGSCRSTGSRFWRAFRSASKPEG